MENKGENHAQSVKQTLEEMIGTDLSLKRKKKSETDLNREMFEKIIIALEKANVRTTLKQEIETMINPFSITAISKPAEPASCLVNSEPIKPAPPVIKIFIRNFRII